MFWWRKTWPSFEIQLCPSTSYEQSKVEATPTLNLRIRTAPHNLGKATGAERRRRRLLAMPSYLSHVLAGARMSVEPIRRSSDRVYAVERALMLAAQAGQCRWVACRVGCNLSGRRQTGRNRQCSAVEEIAAGNPGHVVSLARD